VELLTPNNCDKLEQFVCPPKKSKTCKRVRFEGSRILGRVTFARVPVTLLHSGNIWDKLIVGGSDGDVAPTVNVAVNVVVIVSIPLSTVDIELVEGVTVIVVLTSVVTVTITRASVGVEVMVVVVSSIVVG
jgi:hypothetical protein